MSDDFHNFLTGRLYKAIEATKKDPYDYGTVKLWVGDALAILDHMEHLYLKAEHNRRWALTLAKGIERKERT